MTGPRTRCNAGGALTNDSGTSEPTPAVSRIPTLTPTQIPAPVQAPAPTPVPASVPGPPGRYTDENL